MSQVQNQIALVTGANRGLGKEFVNVLLARGIKKVYAGARDPKSVEVSDSRIVPIALDVTSPASIEAAASQLSDVTIVINNAGVAGGGSVLTGDLDAIRAELETNYFGPILVTRAILPAIVANGGGTILNVHSLLSCSA